MSSKNWKLFWVEIANTIEEEYGKGHPNTWGQVEIENFLEDFGGKLNNKMKQKPSVAIKCGVNKEVLGKIKQWTPIVDTSFRRIFYYKQSIGHKSTRHAFAIYLGYNSAEDFISKKGLWNMDTLNVNREIPLMSSENNYTWDKNTVEISKKFLSLCMEYGFDAALASEAKRVVNTDVEIKEATLNVEIEGTSLSVIKTYKGFNSSDNEKESFNFDSLGDLPVDWNDMNIYAKDLIKEIDYEVSSKDRELSNSKNYTIKFPEKLKPKEDFHIEVGYFLKNIAKISGKDYLVGVLSFDQPVHSYICNISFNDFPSKTLKVINVGEDKEFNIKPNIDNNLYRYTFSLNQNQVKNLNQLRLLILYDRI
ncbi:hypothetical protein [Tenacibaculum agarivorans]|uniref:hypothetical protein n=1 Tax=Tenacibaculum agarivorans TaxID=1908389 RepID=UPI00094BC17B|nr:hypothetical protein [Tenacibaculum agarivorans]